jgi:hypothetical protein
MVSYFGLDEQGEPVLGRYYCYHVLGGPGPTADAGLATITTLAVYDERQRCDYCQAVHAVETGGPAAAVAKAVWYLDSIHQHKHVRKVQSELRGRRTQRTAVSSLPSVCCRTACSATGGATATEPGRYRAGTRPPASGLLGRLVGLP